MKAEELQRQVCGGCARQAGVTATSCFLLSRTSLPHPAWSVKDHGPSQATLPPPHRAPPGPKPHPLPIPDYPANSFSWV
jgi:hypothetical protein